MTSFILASTSLFLSSVALRSEGLSLAHAAIPGDDSPQSALLGLVVIGALTLLIVLAVKLTGRKPDAAGDEESNEAQLSESLPDESGHHHLGEAEDSGAHDHSHSLDGADGSGAHDHSHAFDEAEHSGAHDHSHDHPHDHSHHEQGLWGRLKSIYHPHSHDAADSFDSALESSALGIRAVKISLVGLLVTAVFQLVIVLISSSVALLADTIHNFSDALTSIPLWIAFVIGRRAATRTYTYGYRRAEDLSGLFIVSVIALSAVLAGWESFERLLNPVEVENVAIVAVAGVIGFIGNEIVAIYRIRVGRRIGSAALVADGYHARTDGLTSLAVVVGAAGVALGFPAADPIIGLVITVMILLILRDAGRQVFRRLMDGVDPAITNEIETITADVEGVLGLSAVRVRWVGHRMQTSLHVEVAEAMTVVEGHEVAEAVRERLFARFDKLDDVTVHVDPEGGDRHHQATVDHEMRRR